MGHSTVSGFIYFGHHDSFKPDWESLVVLASVARVSSCSLFRPPPGFFLCFITKMIWPVSFSRTTQWGQQEWQWGQEGVPPEILSTPQVVQVQVQDQGHLIIWRSSKISKSFCICVSIKSAVKTCWRNWGRTNASLHTAACLLFYCLFFAIVAASVFPILGDNDLFRVYPLHSHPAMASTCVVVFLYGGLTVNCG